MASTCAVSMAMPTITSSSASSSSVTQKKQIFFNPMSIKSSKAVTKNSNATIVKASSLKDKAVAGLTTAALTASMVIPDAAQAAELSPSLKNFLLSIGAGGVVLVAILGAVIGVSNFDPVKRT